MTDAEKWCFTTQPTAGSGQPKPLSGVAAVGASASYTSARRRLLARMAAASDELIVMRWEAREPLDATIHSRITEAAQLWDSVAQIMEAEHVPVWLETPNPGFDGTAPCDVAARGDIDLVWRALYHIEAGEPS